MKVFFVAGGKMWLCHHTNGTLLVHRVYSLGNHCFVASHSLPHAGYHGVWKGNLSTFFFSFSIFRHPLHPGFFREIKNSLNNNNNKKNYQTSSRDKR